MNRRTPPPAPALADLPSRREPAATTEICAALQTVTPIFGGGYRTRELDDIDGIRVPTVRGHLRFWWRALFAHTCKDAAELYKREAALWGGAGSGGAKKVAATRSQVEVWIEVTAPGELDIDDIDPQKTPGAYVLFPARSEKVRGQETRPSAPRRNTVCFQLTVRAPTAHAAEVRDAVQAWILFGGYGGRTRRGLGSLTVTGRDAVHWLPQAGKPLARELRRLFGRDVFAPESPARQTPMLAGAALYQLGGDLNRGIDAWRRAVDALRDFRQGTTPDRNAPAVEPSPFARQVGSDPEPSRPSLSNWPEPDKVRHLARRELSAPPYSHLPRHNDTPAWPRAGFGLPIVGRFQTKRRGGGTYREPPGFTITWCEASELEPGRRREHAVKPRNRLASPLILKPLPLANGRFAAIALWLHRAWPDGKVVLMLASKVVPGSAAPFDVLVAPEDTPRFAALQDMPTLRAAFFRWLGKHAQATTVVAHRDGHGGAR